MPRTGRRERVGPPKRSQPAVSARPRLRQVDESPAIASLDTAAVAGAVLLIALTFAAYLPAWRAGFIWDDDDYVTANVTLRSLDGLRRIWLEPGAVPQYYPLTFTTFWVERHLWGLRPTTATTSPTSYCTG